MPKIKALTAEQENRQRIADNLALLKNSKNYNTRDMGKLIGKSHVTYQNREDNPLTLTIGEVLKICKHFGVEPEKFVNGILKIS